MILAQKDQIERIEQYKKTKKQALLAEIIQSNVALGCKIAFGLMKKSRLEKHHLDDLQSVAIEAIIIAVNKFNPEKSDSFLPYCKLWMTAKMNEYVKNLSLETSMKDRSGKKLFSNYWKYIFECEQKGLDPTIENISTVSGLKKKNISDFVQVMSKKLEIDNPDTKHQLVSSSLSPDQIAEKKEIFENFNKQKEEFVENLSEREKVVWNDRVFCSSPQFLSQISKKIGITEQGVFLIEKKLIKRFGKILKNSDQEFHFSSLLE